MELPFRFGLLVAACALGVGSVAAETPAVAAGAAATHYFDVLDLHGMPHAASDRSFNIFFDMGAWHGYSLPPIGDNETGFVGPFVHSLGSGRWAGRRFALLALHAVVGGREIVLRPQASHAAPGYLLRQFAADGLTVRETLFFADSRHAWTRNRERWRGYLRAAASSHLQGLPDAVAQRVAVKAIETLIGNWRAARGDLHHDGVVPSYSNPDFNGFWAWDSWKHAAALALFAPDLAHSQICAMFDYQAADGMVPDCVFIDKANDNWRDSKPPLATWAMMKVYDATHDQAFLAEMYPKLVHYHRWWFAARDHDHDGLAEYGSADGTAIAAKWESGMDNAVRFDHIAMLHNGAGAWSMDQESVDLNSYLYAEAEGLARIAGILGKPQDRAQWRDQAARLKHAIQTRMFDAKAGWFFDLMSSGERVRVYGSEGWSPLWTGAATSAQAGAVAKLMADPDKFGTPLPLPALARDDPHFSPIKGYWRGPVWLDQALFGIEGLQRYGFGKLADRLALRLVDDANGLAAQAPFYENYDPLTGHGYQSRNFSWSAASYLLLLHAGIGRQTGLDKH